MPLASGTDPVRGRHRQDAAERPEPSAGIDMTDFTKYYRKSRNIG